VEPEDALAGLAIVVGLAGIVVPILPGTVLVGLAVLAWAAYVGGSVAWTAAAVAVAVLGVGAVVKYALPGRDLKARGIPRSTLVVGGLLGIVGFFVVPVVGLFLGFVLGVYLAELRRVGRTRAWPATTAALRAVGFSMLIELVAALIAAAVWVAAATAT
jgi:uncharacterized protein YqgC (DUF456 family)